MLIVLPPTTPAIPGCKYKRRKRSISTPPLRSRCRGSKRWSSIKDETERSDNKEETDGRNSSTVQRSVSECYFVVKGAAIVLPHDECMHVYRKARTSGGTDIQQHLQSMLYLLRPNDILRMAVKLESVHAHRMRYLVVVSCMGHQNTEESCLLGIDCNSKTTIGLVLPVWADTQITLDGDGGFSVSSSGRHHIFKPVSVQAMWSALQTLHKASEKARKYTYYMGGGTHHWIENYEKRIESDRSCLNEWHAMDDLVSRRPPSPDTTRSEPSERETAEKQIRTKLKELMMSVDLDEVTSKYIRNKLEEQLDLNLNEYKSFIDQEMLTILGQMDAPTEIFEYLYLGSEWNASNLEELKCNRVGHILNVTREIDNFFPGMFEYTNIRVYDDETTEMLQYWDKTYKYIAKIKDEGSKVLVHCKMGISRSASVVIAYVMKAYDWNLDKALDFVKNKRNCIKPNSGFLKQLEIYQGILDASKQRHNTLWRSKSETNLKSPERPKKFKRKEEKRIGNAKQEECSYLMLPGCIVRPKSWSPDDATADILLSLHTVPIENTIDVKDETEKTEACVGRYEHDSDQLSYCGTEIKAIDLIAVDEETASSPKSDADISDVISSNEISTVTLDVDTGLPRVSSIKDRINKLESQANTLSEAQKSLKHETSNKSGLVLNLANQFECGGSKPGTPSPVDEGLTMKTIVDSLEQDVQGVDPVISQMKPPIPKHHAVLIKPPPWPTDNSDKPNQFPCLADNDTSSYQQNKNFLQTAKQIPSVQCDFTSKIVGKVTPAVYPDAERKNNHIENDSSVNALQKSSSSPACTVMELNTCTQLSQNEIVLQVSIPPSHSSKETVMKQNFVDTSDKHVTERDKIAFWKCMDSSSNTTSDSCITSASKQSQKFTVQNSLKSLGTEENTSKILVSSVGEILSHNYLTQKSLETSQTFPADSVTPSEIYNKESIPWTPGTVLRTKQQLEEQNVKNLCDSTYPTLSQSTPSTPPEMCSEVDMTNNKSVQRSNSLRSEHRPSSLYGNKWYPLPALAGPMPFKSPKERLSTSLPEPNNRTEIVHSVSTPSVVDAVNDVLCGTQEILNSAIQSLPLERQRISPPDLPSSAIKSEPDSEALLPFSECVSFNSTNKRQEHGAGDNPLPGTVKQQKEFLENLHTKSTPIKEPLDESKTNKEQMRLIKEYGKSLVIATPSPEVEEKDFGKVKRLTKELEAKSGSLVHKKDRIVIVNRDGEEVDDSAQKISEHSVNLLPSSVIDCRSRLCTGSDLTVQSKVTLINKDRNHTNNTTDKVQILDERVQQPPPTPHRKASLDLECLRKTQTCQSNHLCSQAVLPSSGPLLETLTNIKNIRSLPRSLSSNGLQKSLVQISQQKLTRTTSSENLFNVHVKPSLPSGKTTMLLKSPPYTIVSPPPPPPPPPGPPRKVRKQQGKTHPLSKLTVKQRHANPLYNTM